MEKTMKILKNRPKRRKMWKKPEKNVKKNGKKQ